MLLISWQSQRNRSEVIYLEMNPRCVEERVTKGFKDFLFHNVLTMLAYLHTEEWHFWHSMPGHAINYVAWSVNGFKPNLQLFDSQECWCGKRHVSAVRHLQQQNAGKQAQYADQYRQWQGKQPSVSIKHEYFNSHHSHMSVFMSLYKSSCVFVRHIWIRDSLCPAVQ